MRTRSTIPSTGEAANYLKFAVEEIISKILARAEEIHIEKNIERAKAGKRVIVNIEYGTVVQALGEIVGGTPGYPLIKSIY